MNHYRITNNTNTFMLFHTHECFWWFKMTHIWIYTLVMFKNTIMTEIKLPLPLGSTVTVHQNFLLYMLNLTGHRSTETQPVDRVAAFYRLGLDLHLVQDRLTNQIGGIVAMLSLSSPGSTAGGGSGGVSPDFPFQFAKFYSSKYCSERCPLRKNLIWI